ncbi:MAG TPA: tRNA (5-methylaminomethyl-2-thiouridine)(34)-methyltransferase MnmD [Chryseolinea sp.]|nr:tRNA (5-methylaminomethyl-2-thiouridine)(34)-methyltransferase MnmD [Chryseolinea sp.]
MRPLELITTGDGSHSLFLPEMDETYHSRHGAIQESQHVFIQHGLRYWLGKTRTRSLAIFEVGFGTGLNAWLTNQVARQERLHIRYFSIEAYPIQRDVWTQLNYAPLDDSFRMLHEVPWNTMTKIDEHFSIHKIHGKLETQPMPAPVDLIYFDAFAPNKQPELWSFPVLEKVCSALLASGVFVTYCAKGQLKRDLRALGLHTETLPGPPGKKEMVRAVR